MNILKLAVCVVVGLLFGMFIAKNEKRIKAVCNAIPKAWKA